ncbi:hypothetical protein MPTK2_4g04310 [Marchantia polymorpha subsp. ruderalis]
MAGDPEKRFERAMGRLFSTTKSSTSPPAPAASSAGASTPSRISNMASVDRRGQTRAVTPLSTPSSRPPRAAVSTSTPGHGSAQTFCRPWDRGDLLRRLATFKSITWFGKPQVAGPVACARRGWVNVDIDLLACEGCGARLSFPVPPSWTRTQVDSAAEAFGEQLESGHKALCAWKGNACSESLALFPPTPLPDLVGGYNDRCEAILQLSALPVISSTAVDVLKVSRGSQVENILAQPPPLASGFPYENERYVSGAESGEKSETGYSYNGFYQAQRLIALCGWEPRLLPYTVDCEERTAPSTRTFRSVGFSDEMKARTIRDPGPSVLLVSRGERVDEKQDTDGFKASPEKKCDPASAVLDCNLCGASVGLWGFSTIPRPSAIMGSVLADMPVTPKSFPNTPMCGASAASGIHGGSGLRHRGKQPAEQQEEAGEATTTPVRVRPSSRGVLDLSLTIAGGPPPTQLSSPAMIPPTFGPIPAFQPRFGQAEASEMGDWVASYESRGPQVRDHGAHQVGSTVDTSNGRPLPADSAEGTVVDHNMDDGEVGKGADSLKRKRRTDSSAVDQFSQGAAVTSGAANANVEVEPEVQGTLRKRNKRAQGALMFARQDPRDFPRSSSVNAIDTYYTQKQENSMESVENHREDSDGHETAASGETHDLVDQVEGTETVVQAQHSGCREAGSGRSVQPVEPGLSKSDEVGCDEGAETNVAVISTGTGTGGGASVAMGGGSVGMEGSHEAELQGEVNGADFSVHRTHSVAEDAEKADLRDARGDSHEVMLASGPGKRRSKAKGPTEGESGESRGKRICVDDRDQTDDEGTVDTTKAVIFHGDSALEKEATDGHMAAGNADEDNGCTTVNGPGRGLEEMRIWETETGEFDPIRQHRHFCPWVNVQVAAAASSSSSAACGWQLTVDAIHTSQPGGLAETESTASMYKADPLLSVRKMLGTSPSKLSPPKQQTSRLVT